MRSAGPFAAVIGDMHLPGMGGLDLMRAVAGLTPATVRLALSGPADFAAAVAAVKDGVVAGFHTKPVPPEVVADSLGCALSRQGAGAGGGQTLADEASALRRALAERELRLYLQPQCRVADGAVTGAEALARWQHPQRGLLQPGEFLAAAEAAGLMEALTIHMLDQACAEIRRWMGLGLPPVRVAINATARNFTDPAFPVLVRRVLDAHEVPPHLIEIELTEGVAIADMVGTQATVRALADGGVYTSIDDVSTGHTSLDWLRPFPVRQVKIDRVFIDDIGHDGVACRLLEHMVGMAHELNLTVLAEGVETTDQMALVRAAGCDAIQGFLVARPMPAASFAEWCGRRGRPAAFIPPGQ